jgi:hypothetical protein
MSAASTFLRGRPTVEAPIAALERQLREAIEQRWRSFFPEADPDGTAIVIPSGSPRQGTAGESVLFRYEVTLPGAARPVFVCAKVRPEQDAARVWPGGGPSSRDRARVEFDRLGTAHGYFRAAAGGLDVVRPIGCLPELNAVVTAHAQGAPLDGLARRGSHLCAAAVIRCGEWLRLFHEQVHARSLRSWDHAAFSDRVVRRHDALVRAGVRAEALARLTREVLEASESAAGGPVPCSTRHGDFRLRHVHVTPAGIEVLDFGHVAPGDCYDDVAGFIADLEGLRYGRPWLSARRLDRLGKAFLRAYFESDLPALLHVAVADVWLQRWESRRAGSAGPASRPRAGTRLAAAADRLYVDRWFSARIREALAAARRTGTVTAPWPVVTDAAEAASR